jgi:hypothetical protein
MHHIREWHYCIGQRASRTRRLEKLVERRQAYITARVLALETGSLSGSRPFAASRHVASLTESSLFHAILTFQRSSFIADTDHML